MANVTTEQLNALKRIVSDRLKNVHEQIKNLAAQLNLDGNEEADEEEVVAQIIRALYERGFIQEIVRSLDITDSLFDESTLDRTQDTTKAPLEASTPPHILSPDLGSSKGFTVLHDDAERFPEALDSLSMGGGARPKLSVQLLGGKAFLEELFPSEELKITTGLLSPKLFLHLLCSRQRFLSKGVECGCDPLFSDVFVIDLPSTINHIIHLKELIHMVIVKKYADGSTSLVGCHNLEWRRVLYNGSCTVSAEFVGMGTKIPVGIVDLRLEILPKLQKTYSLEDINTQINFERAQEATLSQIFFASSQKWWKEFCQLGDGHDSRLIPIYAQNEGIGEDLPVCCFVRPLQGGRSIDSPRHAARFVSLFEYQMDQTLGPSMNRREIWPSLHTFLCKGRGNVEGHCLLLCSLLLGYGMDAYVVTGTRGSYMWVMTLDAQSVPTFWDSLTGHQYQNPGESRKHKFKTIEAAFNHRFLYANHQPSTEIGRTHLEVRNNRYWKPMDQTSITSHIRVCEPRLVPSSLQVSATETEIETALTNIIVHERRTLGLMTFFDDDLSYLLSSAISVYETERITGTTLGGMMADFQHSIKRVVPEGHTFLGFPLQFSHRSPRKMMVALLRSKVGVDILECKGDQARHALRAKVYAYPEGRNAVWIMLAVRFIKLGRPISLVASFTVDALFSITNRRQVTMNGIITSHDITRVILHTVLNRGIELEVLLHRKRKRSCPESHNTWRRKQFVLLRSTCKLWKDVVDGFTDWLTEDDLLLAVRDCMVDSVRFLLTCGGLDPSVRNNKPIQMACQDGFIEIVRLLLSDPRVDPSVKDNEALREAASEGHDEVVRLLMADPRVDPSANDNKVIRGAQFGSYEVVKLLLEDSRVDPSANHQQAIKRASRSGSTKVVRLLLSDPRVDPSADDNEAIIVAASNGYTEVVQLLMSHPLVDPFVQNYEAIRRAEKDKHTEVMHLLWHHEMKVAWGDLLYTQACEKLDTKDYKDLEQLFLSHPLADPSVVDNITIRYASRLGLIELVRTLMSDPRVDLSARNNEAFRWAASEGHHEVVQLLLADARVDPSTEDNYALRVVAAKGHHVVIPVLLADPRLDPSARQNEALREAAEKGHHEVIRLLLADPRVDPSARDNDAFIWAASKGHHEVVRLLLADARVDPSAEDNYALRVVAMRGQHEAIPLLLADPRVDPSTKDNHAFKWAATKGHDEVVRLLLADPRLDPSAEHNKAFRKAAAKGHHEVVRLLLADPRVYPSTEDNMAFRKAALKGHHEVIRLLLADIRVDPSTKDNHAFRWAATKGHHEVIQLLLADPRVDPSAEDNYFLAEAAANGHHEVVRLLLADPRVDPSAEDNYSLTEAAANGHHEVVWLLLADSRVDLYKTRRL
ncbi:centrosomal protein [Planoprotostelium fungivorum]|uniref:Centrosomal protein n=1 Tax=Planoprotostelium fungivorum TaxID=1890364 RepID=A0A2P6MU49_9EUKA|nr:centrosomal protein [Planoprotostelium fungivorum]